MLYVIAVLIILHIAILFLSPEKVLAGLATKFLLGGILLICAEMFYLYIAQQRASVSRSSVGMDILERRKKEAPDIFHAIQDYKTDTGIYPATFSDLKKHHKDKQYFLWENYSIIHLEIKQQQCLLLIPDQLSKIDDVFCYFDNMLLILNTLLPLKEVWKIY